MGSSKTEDAYEEGKRVIVSPRDREKEKQGWISNWNPSTEKNMAYIGPETWR